MKTVSGKQLSQIGIGTWGVGGRGHRNVVIFDKLDDKIYVDALVYALERGINFTEVSIGYGHGQSLALFKEALDKSPLKRDDVFVTNSNYIVDFRTLSELKQDIKNFYKVMGTDYADSTLVTQSTLLKFGEKQVYDILHDILDREKTRYVSLSNAGPELIKNFKNEFDDKFYAHEGFLSFEARALQDKGVLGLCDDLKVKNNIWRPLRKNLTAEYNWPLLVELSEKYRRTQNQIILNWMCCQRYGPMVFATSKEHIDENISSIDFEMKSQDYKRINDFRPANFISPPIDWEGEDIDNDLVDLSNEFEKNLKNCYNNR